MSWTVSSRKARSFWAAKGLGTRASRSSISRNFGARETCMSERCRHKSKAPARIRESLFAAASRDCSPDSAPASESERTRARAAFTSNVKQAQRASSGTSAPCPPKPSSSSSVSRATAEDMASTKSLAPPLSRMYLVQVALPTMFERHRSRSRATLPPAVRSSSLKISKSVSTNPCTVTMVWMSLLEVVRRIRRPRHSFRT
mmetsp:Transcript_47562/g.103390  ORF Transcript_47562/g.103390 Transcript_47562/m.103390 type:complete len:201 (-) Transcript_47562:596-1198(-)